MTRKVDYVIKALDETDPFKWFIHADCDIQFFGDPKEDLLLELDQHDIAFQNDIVCACAGFFICKQTTQTKNFFKEVMHRMESSLVGNKLKKGISDQVIINQLIKEKFPLKFSLLDKYKYFTVAASSLGPKQWKGKHFDIPPELLVHHANWTVGIKRKVDLLEFVKLNHQQKKAG